MAEKTSLENAKQVAEEASGISGLRSAKVGRDGGEAADGKVEMTPKARKEADVRVRPVVTPSVC